MKRYISFIFVLVIISLSIAKDEEGKGHHPTANIQRSESTIFNSNGKSNSFPSFSRQSSTIKIMSKVEPRSHITKIVAYYRGYCKKNGWIEGQNKIDIQTSKHLNLYYRFTKMSDSKHWQLVETLNAYGNYRTGVWQTYIVNPNDETDKRVNKEYKEELNKVCMVEMIPDKSGNNIIEERAYDSSKKLVYSYYPTPISKNVVSGYYLDGNGCPIASQADSLGDVSVSVVHVTYDKDGYESLIEFFDNKGNRQKNRDGAYMSRYFYKNGYCVKYGSCNLIGNYMIDEFGNCGVGYKYNDKGLELESVCFDDKEKPIRIKSRGGNTIGIMRTKNEYDKYGRGINQTFWTMDNKPDTNYYGVHCIKTDFNDRGDLTRWSSYDINGQPCSCDSSNVFEVVRKYDKNGNQTLFELKDKNGDYINNSSGCCKAVYKYDEEGNTISETDYKNGNASLIDYYSYTHINNIKKWIWKEDDYCQIDSFNTDGKLGSETFCNLKGEPKNKLNEKDSRYIHSYTNDNSLNGEIEKYLDVNGNLINNTSNYCQRIIISDIHNNNNITQTINTNGEIVSYYAHTFDKTTGNILSEINLNKFGNEARIKYNNDMMFYKVNVTYDAKGNFSSFIGENEFGEPSYIYNDNLIYYYSDIKRTRYYDENGDFIPNMQIFKNKLPCVYTFLVEDSIGYKRGVKDGDVVLRYGNWWFSFDSDKSKSDNALAKELSRVRDTTKTVLVLRHHPETKTSEIIELTVPGGPTARLSYVYYTQKEKSRLQSYYLPYLKEHNIKVMTYKSDSDSIKYAKEWYIYNVKQKYSEDMDYLYDMLAKIYSGNMPNYYYLQYKKNKYTSDIYQYLPQDSLDEKLPFYFLWASQYLFGIKEDQDDKYTPDVWLQQISDCINNNNNDDVKDIFRQLYYIRASILLTHEKIERKMRKHTMINNIYNDGKSYEYAIKRLDKKDKDLATEMLIDAVPPEQIKKELNVGILTYPYRVKDIIDSVYQKLKEMNCKISCKN